jgi:hypothetical protein
VSNWSHLGTLVVFPETNGSKLGCAFVGHILIQTMQIVLKVNAMQYWPWSFQTTPLTSWELLNTSRKLGSVFWLIVMPNQFLGHLLKLFKIGEGVDKTITCHNLFLQEIKPWSIAEFPGIYIYIYHYVAMVEKWFVRMGFLDKLFCAIGWLAAPEGLLWFGHGMVGWVEDNNVPWHLHTYMMLR